MNNNIYIITFIDVFRNVMTRNEIFQALARLDRFKRSSSSSINDIGEFYIKGKELRKSLEKMFVYGMDWKFISLSLHLPVKPFDDVVVNSLQSGLNKYVAHSNVTLDSIKKAIEWVGSFQPETDLLSRVASHSELDTLIHLSTQYPQCDTRGALDNAANRGKIDMVKWLHFNRSEPCSTFALDGASSVGSIKVVEFLHFNRSEGCTINALNSAIQNGHLDVIRFLMDNRSEGFSSHPIDEASKRGRLEVVKYLDTRLGSTIPRICSMAAMNISAKNGHLPIVEYLHLNRTEGCNFLAFNGAALNGHLNVLEYLVNNRKERPSANVMINAVLANRLDIVKYLDGIKVGTDYYKKSMDEACTRNYMEIVEFFHGTGTKCSKNAMVGASRNGHLGMVMWLHYNHGDDLLDVKSDAVDQAAESNHLEVVRFLLINRPSSTVSDSTRRLIQRSGYYTHIADFLNNHTTTAI
ncbi:hypothetical protein DFA_09177 [Cavenderia fasciculata]|uniref:Ankyrin repeat-containing protein n=1 Tax=Cavenderia fasciculata TaxID=261658 RepID=F4Q6X0_CACFS|nr:uncharacterized protein DFA_09177 [Cavenderia fasciculata]EGG16152.1 hypothetical protein DFA_09177 [Cavenderia fasciculata]|eukprot:XP_004352605.1 hypothetical protein DFA_09177 [Cavenderia fasciculata]